MSKPKYNITDTLCEKTQTATIEIGEGTYEGVKFAVNSISVEEVEADDSLRLSYNYNIVDTNGIDCRETPELEKALGDIIVDIIETNAKIVDDRTAKGDG